MAAILILDDERLVAMAIAATFEADGLGECFPVATVAAADEQLARRSFSLAVLDVVLKNETVGPLAERVAALGVPIVYITGLALDVARSDGLPPGLWLQKPIGVPALLDAARAVLAGPAD